MWTWPQSFWFYSFLRCSAESSPFTNIYDHFPHSRLLSTLWGGRKTVILYFSGLCSHVRTIMPTNDTQPAHSLFNRDMHVLSSRDRYRKWITQEVHRVQIKQLRVMTLTHPRPPVVQWQEDDMSPYRSEPRRDTHPGIAHTISLCIVLCVPASLLLIYF